MLLERKRMLKITDFSVARVQAQSSEVIGQTGTLGYTAPEVLQGKLYDITSNVFIFGILLWETYC